MIKKFISTMLLMTIFLSFIPIASAQTATEVSVGQQSQLNTENYPPARDDKVRVFLNYAALPEKVSVRKIENPFFIGSGMTDPQGSVPDSIIKDLRIKGLSYFLPFVSWASVEPSQGVFSESFCGSGLLAYLKTSGAILNGHCLLFPIGESYSVPQYAYGLSFDDQKKEIQKYITRMVKTYPDIEYWDLNEPVCQNAFHWTKEQIYDVYVSASQWIHEADPKAKVMINMIPIANNWSGIEYEPNKVLDDLIDRGLEADVIGVELYEGFAPSGDRDGNGYPSIAWVKSRVDIFRKYDLPIIFSEVGVPGVVNGKAQYDKQADWAESFIRFCTGDGDVIGATWYFVRNDGSFNCGLANDDYSYRTVAERLGKLADELNPVREYALNGKPYLDLDPGIYDIMVNGEVTRVSLKSVTSQDDQIQTLTLRATPGDGYITLDWTAVSDTTGLDGYYLYRGTSPNGEDASPIFDFPINALTYKDALVSNGTTYYYILKPCYNKGTQLGTSSNEASATPGGQTGGTIILTIGSPYMKINGQDWKIDPGHGTAPVIIGGTTFLPIRAVIEAMGGSVAWDGSDRKITIVYNQQTINLWIDRTSALVNGAIKNLDVAPYISSTGRTMIPVRFVAENLGCDVIWDESEQRVTIKYRSNSAKEEDNPSQDDHKQVTGNNSIVSDSKCKVIFAGASKGLLPSGWNQVNFDDSQWAGAVEYQYPDWPDPQTSVFRDTAAKWITCNADQTSLPDYDNPSMIGSSTNYSSYLFRREFSIPDGAHDISAACSAAADNYQYVYLNGNLILGPKNAESAPMYQDGYNFRLGDENSSEIPASYFKDGLNVIAVEVRNGARASGTDYHGPMGLLFNVNIAYQVPGGTSEDSNTKPRILLDGNLLSSDTPLFTENNRIMVVMHTLLIDDFKADVSWDSSTRTLTINKNNITASFVIDNTEAVINGNKVYFDTPLRIIDDLTYGPLENVCAALGYKVTWDRESNTYYITSP